MAAGVLLSAGAAAFSGLAVVTVAALRLAVTNNSGLTFDGIATQLLVAAFALGVAGLLAVPTPLWPAPRAFTLVLALVVSAAWPLSGLPLAAGPVAIVAVGLSLARDRSGDRGRRLRGEWPAGVLIVIAAAVLIAGLSATKSHRTPASAKARATTLRPSSSAAHDADTAGTLAPPVESPAAAPEPSTTPDASVTPAPSATPEPGTSDPAATQTPEPGSPGAHDADTSGKLAPPYGESPTSTPEPATTPAPSKTG